MDDIKTFRLQRSQIPTALFKSIVQDVDIMLVQYGPPLDHETEQARSRFLSPVSASHFSDHQTNSNFYSEIFNRLIAIFSSTYRNLPESTIEGRIATKGRLQYHFTTIISTALVLIEVRFRIGHIYERMDAVAQVIAECYGQACS